jgi:VCBS repeat-containing protein
VVALAKGNTKVEVVAVTVLVATELTVTVAIRGQLKNSRE